MIPATIFENHVLISYAYINSARFAESEKRWIDQLHGVTNGLRVRVRAATARSHQPAATQPEVT